MTAKVTVAHYLCPSTEGTDVTHHLKPVRAGHIGGEAMNEQRCAWCNKSEDELRDEINANGGELHPDIIGAEPGHLR